MTYARQKNVHVNISSGNNDYLAISPTTKLPLDHIVFRLLFQRSDRTSKDTSDCYGFQTVNGIPRNLLYLSANQGKVNAVKYMLGKKTNTIAKTFTEIGLDIFPLLRIPVEEEISS